MMKQSRSWEKWEFSLNTALRDFYNMLNTFLEEFCKMSDIVLEEIGKEMDDSPFLLKEWTIPHFFYSNFHPLRLMYLLQA